MAVDTRNKRFSLINVGLPLGRIVSNPDGAINTSAERYQWAGLYAFGSGGVEPEPSDGTASVTLELAVRDSVTLVLTGGD